MATEQNFFRFIDVVFTATVTSLVQTMTQRAIIDKALIRDKQKASIQCWRPFVYIYPY